jgi:chromosome condensin MukBEF ATPase and DNA-binding subunit MukB
MAGSVLKNLEIFASLCGQKAMPNVILVTTMWGDVQHEKGVRREEELKREFWKDMLANGCTTERFQDTFGSAWRIIDGLDDAQWARVQLSYEIVDRRMRLQQTQAGIALSNELKKLMKDRKEAARKLRAQAKKQGNPLVVQSLNQRQAEIDAKIAHTSSEIEKLKISIASQIMSWFRN